MKSYPIDVGTHRLEARIAVSKDGAEPVVLDGLALSPDGATVTAASPFGAVTVKASAGKRGVVLTASLDLAAPCRSIDLFPVFGATLDGATHLLSHGRSMGRCKSSRIPATPNSGADAISPEAATLSFESYFQTVVTFPDGHLHVTQPLRQPNLTCVRGRIEGKSVRDFSVSTHFDFPGAGVVEAAPTTIAFVADAFDAMNDYADAQVAIARPGDKSPPAPPPPVGWNSWDYYRWTITEDEVLKNADFIASDPVLSKHVRRIIVDDGWQYCYGEWDANPLFPSGMASLATRLRRMGFTPGLWICPFVAEPHSRIAQVDCDMLAMSEGGTPCLAFECMRRYGFILDPTVAKTREFLRSLFDRYAGYGYGYFKIDFLMQLFKAPRFHDDSIPRGELLRTGLRPILDGIAGRADLLGCGYAYEAGCDLVRTVRAGADIHSTWRNAKANAVSVAARAWASNRLWVTDPDFCVCRGPETSNDPDLERLQCLHVFTTPSETSGTLGEGLRRDEAFASCTAAEARSLLSVAIVNGGAINLSDKLYALNEVGLDLVRRTVSAERGGAPVPLDLFSSDIAAKWIQPTPSGLRALLVNWLDTPQELSINLAARGIAATSGRDFWTDAPLSAPDGILRAQLAPHACLLAEFAFSGGL